MVNGDSNESPSLQESIHRRPNQKFLGFKVIPNSKYWEKIGCPVYVLEGNKQSGNITREISISRNKCGFGDKPSYRACKP